MNTKDGVLTLLERRRGEAVSGQELAAGLGVSRAAIWKAVEALRQEGHNIAAAPNRGYCLDAKSDVLCLASLLPHLKREAPLHVFQEVASTNTLLREMALKGAPHGTVVLANQQSGGKGRRGRSFLSPAGGIYLSVLLRPQAPAQEATGITIAACVGVCRAMRDLCGLEGEIKWVNDVFLRGRKVCGILTEAATSLENGMLDYAVVGVGLNFRCPREGFPPALRDIAGSLYGPEEEPPVSRCAMAAGLIDSLLEALEHFDREDILAEYRARSMVTGREVLVLRGEESRPALAQSIQADGSLRVRYRDGSMEDLCSGEVSILPVKGQDLPTE